MKRIFFFSLARNSCCFYELTQIKQHYSRWDCNSLGPNMTCSQAEEVDEPNENLNKPYKFNRLLLIATHQNSSFTYYSGSYFRNTLNHLWKYFFQKTLTHFFRRHSSASIPEFFFRIFFFQKL